MALRLVTYFWLLMTLVLLLKPGIGYEQHVLFAGEDKVVHFGLFSSLTMLWYRHFVRQLGMSIEKTAGLMILYGIGLSALTEILQDYIPGRETDMIDFVANMVGVTAGVLFSFILEKRNHSLVNKMR